MVAVDDNKMHQNIAFQGIKFPNFLGKGHGLLPHHIAILSVSAFCID